MKCRCGDRAHVRLEDDSLVCWVHYNQAVTEKRADGARMVARPSAWTGNKDRKR